MTALALFAAFMQQAGVDKIDVSNPEVMAGLFLGAMLPFLFSSLAMKAVGEAAMDMIEEVRRQFREIPGLKEGNAEPDSAKCVEISTQAAIKQMILESNRCCISCCYWIWTFRGSIRWTFAGVTVSGVCMAIFMSNAGGAWDNTKKSFEGGGYTMEDGETHPKGSLLTMLLLLVTLLEIRSKTLQVLLLTFS